MRNQLIILVLSALIYSSECAGHNETCLVTEDCTVSDPYLECIAGVCLCDPVDYVFEKTQCVGLVGTPCLSDTRCISNTECLQTCKCLNGYVTNSIRRCNSGYSSPCYSYTNNVTDIGTCGEDFVCIDGRCGCRFPDSQILVNSRDEKCRSLVSGNCDSDLDCVPNAQCTDNVCNCASGFVENVNGNCVLDYGSPCDYRITEEIKPDTLNICDPLVPLKCFGGTCSCSDPSRSFNAFDRTCRLPIGSRCDPVNGTRCVENAVCVQSNSLGIAGRCQYDDDTLTTTTTTSTAVSQSSSTSSTAMTTTTTDSENTSTASTSETTTAGTTVPDDADTTTTSIRTTTSGSSFLKVDSFIHATSFASLAISISVQYFPDRIKCV